MVKPWVKFIYSLDKKLRKRLLKISEDIINNELSGYDVKRLSWAQNLYRCRFWNIRIIFRKSNTKNEIKKIDFRGGIYK